MTTVFSTSRTQAKKFLDKERQLCECKASPVFLWYVDIFHQLLKLPLSLGKTTTRAWIMNRKAVLVIFYLIADEHRQPKKKKETKKKKKRERDDPDGLLLRPWPPGNPFYQNLPQEASMFGGRHQENELSLEWRWSCSDAKTVWLWLWLQYNTII